MTQPHGSSLWREPAGGGAVPSVKKGIFVGAQVPMVFEWNYGDPLPTGLVFAGDANRWKLDATGVYRSVAANVPRNDGYVYDKNGLLVPGWLIEGQRTNSALWSRDLTQASVWGKTAGLTVALNATGLDGTPNSATTLADTTATNAEDVNQNVTIPVDSNTHAVQFWIQKDTNTARFPGIMVAIIGGTLVQRLISFNTASGAFADLAVIGTSTVSVQSAGAWWRVTMTITNNSTASNTTLELRAYPSLGTTLGQNSVTPTGSIVIGQVQCELNVPFGSSPIFTGAAAVTRVREWAYVPWYYGPQAATFYTKYVDQGAHFAYAASRIFEIDSKGASADPRWLMFAANATTMQEFYNTPGHVQQAVNLVPGVVVGDTVELRATLSAAGAVQPGISVNGAAEILGGASAGLALPDNWGATPILSLGADGAGNENGYVAFQSIRLALAVRTLRQMQKLDPDPGYITLDVTGTPAASLVSDGAGGYDLSDTNLAGTGTVAVVGSPSIGVLYK